MVDVLIDLRENHDVIGVKAEFEAEGTRLEEAMRLKEVVTAAGLGLTLKIGGCEAVRDLYEARVLGVERVVAPMVESGYALKKFLGAAKMAFPEDEREDTKWAVNVETIDGANRFDEMLALDDCPLLDGIVVGRTDMSGSLGLGKDAINDPQLFEITKVLFEKAKAAGLETAVGGGVSAESLPFFRRLGDTIDRYETRKVIFGCPGALADDAQTGILKAVGFEMMWLQNKRDFYGSIAREDDSRLKVLEARYAARIHEAGGMTA
jgi:hypothetical protein